MLTSLAWLALEVKYLDPAREFYETHLDLPVAREREGEVAFAAGDTDLVLRAPGPVPRGGLHVHYAMSTPADRYDDWWKRLEGDFDLDEHTFGSARSLYFYDCEGNCVEIGQSDDGGADITGVFEVVLEVEDLARAERFYSALGMDVVDRGEGRKRVRLTAGPFDFELWEPHLGLADARGGVHVDLGIETEDPTGAADAVRGQALAATPVEEGMRVRDPDGHYLTFL
ncbi:VOC family protein [Halomarina litorea]|uniref:VOC family protein n=1 Tax=Halomarina litorea TaxID=2961595 RepID=UPI0020C4F067|nr:VOC family protein [Halomarina sp. BCD28]